MSEAITNNGNPVDDEIEVVPEKEISSVIEEIIPEVSKEKKDKLVAFVECIEMYKGPIPHPSIIAEYEKLIPGSADRILSMAERQSSHRISLQSKVVEAEIKNSKKGQIFGFVLAILMIGAGITFAFLGMEAGAITTIIITICGLSALFINSRVFKKRDLESKSPE